MVTLPPHLIYKEVYSRFLNAKNTVPNQVRDFDEWHLGRKTYSLWAIEIAEEKTRGRYLSAQEQLSAYLVHPYHRQPHITLYVCGFLTDRSKLPDDFSKDQLNLQIDKLKSANLKPFEIEIGGINSFSISPFLEVDDRNKGIEKIKQILLSQIPENRQEKFVSHITLGLYDGVYPSDHVTKMYNNSEPMIKLIINKISFMAYDPSIINGALRTIDTLSF